MPATFQFIQVIQVDMPSNLAEFLFEYGMFLAKFGTVLIVVIAVVVIVLLMVLRARRRAWGAGHG